MFEFYFCLVAKLLPFPNSIFKRERGEIEGKAAFFAFVMNIEPSQTAQQKINPIVDCERSGVNYDRFPTRLCSLVLWKMSFVQLKNISFLLGYFAFVEIAQSHNKTPLLNRP
jgi:hypothetical protein